ncbi:MAG: hypothetical protein WDN69_28920 [Aliidongia sp.]
MVQSAFGSFLSVVCELEVGADSGIRLRRVVAAMDCGQAVNPDSVRAQLEGRVGLRHDGCALWRDHTRQGSGAAGEFRQLPRAAHERDAADRRSIWVESTEKPGGLGEPAPRPPSRPSPMRFSPRPASGYGNCRWPLPKVSAG